MVLDVSEAKIGDFDYFRAIEDQMQQGGYEAMLEDLLHMSYDMSKGFTESA